VSNIRGLTPYPEEFGIYLNYVRKLGFEETPDYDFLRELFAKVMKNNGDIDDGVYEWNTLNGECNVRS
jgi:casein kinase 1